MKRNFLALCILALGSMTLTFYFFYPIIFDLNHILLTGSGDGIKNYFTYLYYLKNDFGTHFTGMNYPFGEDVVFTDNTPLLAWSIKGLSNFCPSILNNALGILHTLLLSSVTIGAIYIYRIIRAFNVAKWWSIVSSLYIIFFSPQLFKLTGFFGMGFIMYLPMMIYWLLKYHQTGRIKYIVGITVITILFTFLHVYNLAFTLVLLGCYTLSYLLVNLKNTGYWKKAKHFIPIVASIFISWAVLNLYMQIFDKISDRTTYPYGVFGATTEGGDIFNSNMVPLGYVFQFLFGRAHGLTEGYTYIGFVSIAIFVFLLYRFVVYLVSLKQKTKHYVLHPVRAYRIWLGVAFFELLVSMGVPFSWGLRFLADYLSVLRQFRSMGRFSWAFYYLFLIFCVIFIFRLYQWLRRKGIHWQAKAMLGAVCILWGIQLNGYAGWMRENVSALAKDNYNRLFSAKESNWNDWLSQNGYSAKQFQAILALPFFHIGSEKLWLQDNDAPRTMYYGAQLALQTGIPMIDVMMSRTSWSQTFATVQLTDGPFSPKPLLDSFSNKPILVLVNKQFPLKPKEKEWLLYSKLIGTRNDLDLYSVSIRDIITHGKEARAHYKIIAAGSKQQEGLIGNDAEFYFVRHFDQYNTPAFAGNGAFSPAKTYKEQMIADICPKFTDSTEHQYFFSIWVLCNNTDYRTPYFIFRQFDKNGRQIAESDLNTKYSTRVIHNWYLIDKLLTLDKKMDHLKVYVVNPDNRKSYIALDELTFWPENSVFFYKTKNGVLLLNNRPQ
ncbi:MAG TPA: hypothetical protein VFL76_11735 [Edaphocola sp.]|nr:hypothetical protein [Edaphocola sp.]